MHRIAAGLCRSWDLDPDLKRLALKKKVELWGGSAYAYANPPDAAWKSFSNIMCILESALELALPIAFVTIFVNVVMKDVPLTGDAVYRELVRTHATKPPAVPFAVIAEILAAFEEDGAVPLANRTGQAAKALPAVNEFLKMYLHMDDGSSLVVFCTDGGAKPYDVRPLDGTPSVKVSPGELKSLLRGCAQLIGLPSGWTPLLEGALREKIRSMTLLDVPALKMGKGASLPPQGVSFTSLVAARAAAAAAKADDGSVDGDDSDPDDDDGESENEDESEPDETPKKVRSKKAGSTTPKGAVLKKLKKAGRDKPNGNEKKNAKLHGDCHACGSLDHMVRDCDDAEELRRYLKERGIFGNDRGGGGGGGGGGGRGGVGGGGGGGGGRGGGLHALGIVDAPRGGGDAGGDAGQVHVRLAGALPGPRGRELRESLRGGTRWRLTVVFSLTTALREYIALYSAEHGPLARWLLCDRPPGGAAAAAAAGGGGGSGGGDGGGGGGGGVGGRGDGGCGVGGGGSGGGSSGGGRGGGNSGDGGGGGSSAGASVVPPALDAALRRSYNADQCAAICAIAASCATAARDEAPLILLQGPPGARWRVCGGGVVAVGGMCECARRGRHREDAHGFGRAVGYPGADAAEGWGAAAAAAAACVGGRARRRRRGRGRGRGGEADDGGGRGARRRRVRDCDRRQRRRH